MNEIRRGTSVYNIQQQTIMVVEDIVIDLKNKKVMVESTLEGKKISFDVKYAIPVNATDVNGQIEEYQMLKESNSQKNAYNPEAYRATKNMRGMNEVDCWRAMLNDFGPMPMYYFCVCSAFKNLWKSRSCKDSVASLMKCNEYTKKAMEMNQMITDMFDGKKDFMPNKI